MNEEDALEKELQDIETKMREEKKQRESEAVTTAVEEVIKEKSTDRNQVHDEMDISTTPPPPTEIEINEVDLIVSEPPIIMVPPPPELPTYDEAVPSPPPPPIISVNIFYKFHFLMK